MTTDEQAIAYLDDAMDPTARADFEARMAADPGLAAKLAEHRQLAARVSGAYAPALDEPVPPGLIAMATAANDVGRRRIGLAQWATMAACLVVGLLAGRLAWPEPAPLTARDGTLVAQGRLAKALNTQLAADAGPLKVGLSFRARDGRYCRTFENARDGMAGLACRTDKRWVAEALAALHPGAETDYATASSATPAPVLAAVDAMIAGEVLDAAGERAARARSWQP